jgi:hypothetical protein
MRWPPAPAASLRRRRRCLAAAAAAAAAGLPASVRASPSDRRLFITSQFPGCVPRVNESTGRRRASRHGLDTWRHQADGIGSSRVASARCHIATDGIVIVIVVVVDENKRTKSERDRCEHPALGCGRWRGQLL